MRYNPHDINPFFDNDEAPDQPPEMGMVEGETPPPWRDEDVPMTDAEALSIVVYRFRDELGYPPLVLR